MKRFEGFQKGVNLGGWISQFAKYDVEHFNTFITESDIKYIASLGFDHVRVPVDYNVLEDEGGNVIESGFGYLEHCREWCEKYNLNMLIDLHECYGYSFDPLKKDMDRRKFFYDEALQNRFFSLWRRDEGGKVYLVRIIADSSAAKAFLLEDKTFVQVAPAILVGRAEVKIVELLVPLVDEVSEQQV